MKTAVYLLVLCFLGSCFAAHLQSSGLGWQGTWSENKRSFGGNMYICVDIENNVAYGSYSGAGLFSGVLKGTEFTGEWFEAGYDRPFGPFSLTLSGTSFSGSWSYYNNTSADSTETFAWSGSRSSSSRPSVEQCLVPAQGVAVTGTYENVENICYRPADRYQNTNLPGVFGGFESFGFVGGYTPDAGRSVFMSDFVYRNDDSISLRPETSASVFGPCSSNSDCNGPNTGDDSERVQTQKIVIGALVDDATFCGFFWEGFYNDQISDGAICFSRTGTISPDSVSCGGEAVIAANRRQDIGNTELLLSEIQRVLDAITMPSVVIVPGPFDGDDDNYGTGFFDQFLDDDDEGSDDIVVDDNDDNNDDDADDDNNDDDADDDNNDDDADDDNYYVPDDDDGDDDAILDDDDENYYFPDDDDNDDDQVLDDDDEYYNQFDDDDNDDDLVFDDDDENFSSINFTASGNLETGSFASALVIPLATIVAIVALAF